MEDLEKLGEKVVSVLKRHGVERVGLFGSYVNGRATPESDLDVLVEFRSTKSLLELVRIEREMAEETGVKIDLLTEDSISPYIIEYVKKDLRVVYS